MDKYTVIFFVFLGCLAVLTFGAGVIRGVAFY